jgi:hypothetical protein
MGGILMLRTLLCGFALVGLALVLVGDASFAQEKKDKKVVTLEGKITCGKCDLGVDKACATVIVAKKGGKDVTYYFDAASHKKHHSVVCNEAKDGSVTGTISEDGKKKIITATEVKFK